MQKARHGAAFFARRLPAKKCKILEKTPYKKDIIQYILDKKTLEFLYESARMKLLFCETIAL
jgi:hypothetical protein